MSLVVLILQKHFPRNGTEKSFFLIYMENILAIATQFQKSSVWHYIFLAWSDFGFSRVSKRPETGRNRKLSYRFSKTCRDLLTDA